MKRALIYIAAGIAMYALGLVATLPAGWVYTWGKPRLGDTLMLSGVNGTVWQGRARAAQMGTVRVEKLQWDLRAWALLLGRVSAALTFQYQSQPGRLTFIRHMNGDWGMKDVDLLVPARNFQSLLRLPGTELSGVVAAKFDTLRLQQGRIVAAEGTLTWDKAAVMRPVSVELGGFATRFTTENDLIQGVMKDSGGEVQADGLFKLKPDGQYEFTATFISRDPKQPMINQGLQLFGQPGPDGRVKVDTQGQLPPLLKGAS